jgi:hypothetical protein
MKLCPTSISWSTPGASVVTQAYTLGKSFLQHPSGPPVELSKEILITDVGQQLDHLLQRVLNLLVAQFLAAALLEQVVTEGRQQLRTRAASHPLIAEHLKGFFQSLQAGGCQKFLRQDTIQIQIKKLSLERYRDAL